MQASTSESGQFSFDDVRNWVFANPSVPDELPGIRRGKRLGDHPGAVSSRAEQSNRAEYEPHRHAGDFKDDEPKLFHPKRARAAARWEMFADSGYTGPFAAEAAVPAIIPLSASGNHTRFDSGFPAIPLLDTPWSFGFAVKLFATRAGPAR